MKRARVINNVWRFMGIARSRGDKFRRGWMPLVSLAPSYWISRIIAIVTPFTSASDARYAHARLKSFSMIARFAVSVSLTCHLFPQRPILSGTISRLWTTVCRRFFSRTSLSGLLLVDLSGRPFDVSLPSRECRASQQKHHGIFHYTGSGQFIGACAINPAIDPWLISDSAQVNLRCDESRKRTR